MTDSTARIESLTRWVGAIAPLLAADPAKTRPAARALAASLALDIRVWMALHEETDPAFLAMRERLREKDAEDRAAATEGAKQAAKTVMAVHGPKLWRELHLRALTVAQGVDDSAWLGMFIGSLPCPDCRVHFAGIVTGHPPRWDEYFEWTVGVHNLVNATLGKPAFSLDEARAFYPVT